MLQLAVGGVSRWLALTTAALCAPGLFAQNGAPVDFQREIHPILSESCFPCHGPDSDSRQANLRLDRRDTALAKRPNGAPIVPGDSAASLLYRRISAADPGFRMPPAISHRTLTPAQIALAEAVDRSRCALEGAMGICITRQSEGSRSQEPRLGSQLHRPLHPGPPGRERSDAGRGRRCPYAHSARCADRDRASSQAV